MSVCVPKDKLLTVLEHLGITIGDECPKQSQSQSQSPSQSGTVTLTSQQTKDITEAIKGVLSVPSPISSSNVLSRVMTFYTKNLAPSTLKVNESTYEFDWMGVARLYLTPLNLGNLVAGLKAGQYGIDWIRVKVLGVTMVPSERSGASVVRKEVDDTQPQQSPEMQNAVDNLISLDGTMYTVGYLPASKFLGNAAAIQDAGDSFIKKYHSQTDEGVVNYFTGEGFTTEKITGIETQYTGKYAAMYPDSKTEALASATEIVIQSPVGYPLSVTSSSEIDDQSQIPTNTYSLSGTSGVFTKEETQQFINAQGTAGAVSGATTPFYGMIQIDLPEDLIQDVYQKIEIDARLDQTIRVDPDTDETEYVSSMQEITRWTNKVLNANFKVLIEYGVRQ